MDFFGGLRGSIQGPDTVMGQGPLPPGSTGGMGPGFDGTPDGKINFNSALLSDLQPYAYGEPGRQGSQAGYQNIPHAVTRIVPAFKVPKPCRSGDDGWQTISHQVDDGELAFVVRCMFKPFELVEGRRKLAQKGMLHAVDPIVNLSTLNYLLHGLQRYGPYTEESQNPEHACWHTLWSTLGLDTRFNEDWCARYRAMSDAEGVETKELVHPRWQIANHVIRFCITPFGVPRGSEKQGGQHQGVNFKSVTWPVDFVLSFLIDGKCSNMVNIWRNGEVSAGDDLVLFLEDMDTTQYSLSSHARSTAKLVFPSCGANKVFQLMPGNTMGQQSEGLHHAIWESGYWHIGRSQTMQHGRDIKEDCHNSPLVDGKLVECTFSPVWVQGLMVPTLSRVVKKPGARAGGDSPVQIDPAEPVGGGGYELDAEAGGGRPLSFMSAPVSRGGQDPSVSFLSQDHPPAPPKAKRARVSGGGKAKQLASMEGGKDDLFEIIAKTMGEEEDG